MIRAGVFADSAASQVSAADVACEIDEAEREAIAIDYSTRMRSPVVFTIRPGCCFDLGIDELAPVCAAFFRDENGRPVLVRGFDIGDAEGHYRKWKPLSFWK